MITKGFFKMEMEKLAGLIKQAEVNAFVGALADTGFLKVANDEELAIVADAIAENLPEDYTMEDALGIAGEVIEAMDEGEGEGEVAPEEEVIPEDEDMVVEACDKGEEINEAAAMAAMGELAMAKMAGEISEAEFEKEALSIESLLQGGKGLAQKAYTGNIGAGAKAVEGVRELTQKAYTGDIGAGAKAVKSGFGRALRGTNVKNLKNARGELNASVAKELKDLKARGIDPSGPVASRANFVSQSSAGIGAGIKKALRNERLKTWGTRGAVGAAAGGAGLGAKALYDKYNQ